jgi:transposase
MRSHVQNTLQSMALANGLRRGHSLWSQAGQLELQALQLASHANQRRTALLTRYQSFQETIDDLDRQVSEIAKQRSQAKRLMTHPGVGPVTALATEVFLGDPKTVRRRQNRCQLHGDNPERTQRDVWWTAPN